MHYFNILYVLDPHESDPQGSSNEESQEGSTEGMPEFYSSTTSVEWQSDDDDEFMTEDETEESGDTETEDEEHFSRR